MEIKEGMYARVKGRNNFPGGIAKILKIEEAKGKKWLTLDTALDYSFLVLITNVIKASHNIIDLIEVGDYVNGYIVDEMRLDHKNKGKVLSITYRESYRRRVIVHEIMDDNDIESIVTKEQFESMSYKVGK